MDGFEPVITMSFYDDRIHIWKQTIEYMNKPRYMKLYVDEKHKWFFIQVTEKKDSNTFKIYYTKENVLFGRCHIMAKKLMKYLASVIGVPYPSDSLKFQGRLLEDDRTLYFDLKKYEVIPYSISQKEKKDA